MMTPAHNEGSIECSTIAKNINIIDVFNLICEVKVQLLHFTYHSFASHFILSNQTKVSFKRSKDKILASNSSIIIIRLLLCC